MSRSQPESSQNQNISPIDDRMSPYYVHHLDNPSFILVSQPLTGENYPSWSRSMMITLSVKK